jgi:hypothetical protein
VGITSRTAVDKLRRELSRTTDRVYFLGKVEELPSEVECRARFI